MESFKMLTQKKKKKEVGSYLGFRIAFLSV